MFFSASRGWDKEAEVKAEIILTVRPLAQTPHLLIIHLRLHKCNQFTRPAGGAVSDSRHKCELTGSSPVKYSTPADLSVKQVHL